MQQYIRNEYEKLASQELKFSLIDEAKALKGKCAIDEVYDYYYLCDILIADIYLEHNNYDEPLKILLSDIKDIDTVLYKNIYISLLDRAIYIYITKKNYRLAYRFAFYKNKCIDKTNTEIVNRWYLEMSYIFAQMGEIDKSQEYLEQIINNPTDNVLPYALSNLCKIYIDKKKIHESEQLLNKCLKYTTDEDGKIYCDYLLAKICVLKDQINEALLLYKNIFENDDISVATLPIINEYITLLLDSGNVSDAGLVISKIVFFINASDDYYLKKEYIKNKIRFATLSKSKNDLVKLIEEYEDVNKKIEINQKTIMDDSIALETQEIADMSALNIIKKADKLINIIRNNILGESLRDKIMNYCRALLRVVDFEEATLFLFNKTSNIEYLLNDKIICMNFKKNKLYEKNVTFDFLKGSLMEIVINKNEAIAINFDKTKLDIVNLFNNRKYTDDEIKYVNAIPCQYKNEVFACMVYADRNNDLTSEENSVLLSVATKILEASLSSVFLSENLDVTNETINHLVNHGNIGLFHLSDGIMYLSNPLKSYLKTNKQRLSIADYKKMIAKSDLAEYELIAKQDKAYVVDYKLNIDGKIIGVTEETDPYIDNNNTVLFNIGTITVKDKDMSGLIDGDVELQKRIKDLEFKSSMIEFRYSIIRIRSSINNFSYIRSIFGETPYYVNNKDFIVIMENEVNQKTLDKLTKNIDSKYSIVRYPRDIVNVPESFNLSKVCLDSGYTYFNEDIYKEYLKKMSLNIMSQKLLNEQLPIAFRIYKGYSEDMYEAMLLFPLSAETEDNRELLNQENQNIYDHKLYQTILNKNLNGNVFFYLSNQVLNKIIDANDLPSLEFEDIRFVVYQNDEYLEKILKRLKETKLKVIIDARIIKYISAYNFNSDLITGIIIKHGVNEKEYQNIKSLAKLFKLDILTLNKMDYNRNIYATNEIQKME